MYEVEEGIARHASPFGEKFPGGVFDGGGVLHGKGSNRETDSIPSGGESHLPLITLLNEKRSRVQARFCFLTGTRLTINAASSSQNEMEMIHPQVGLMVKAILIFPKRTM